MQSNISVRIGQDCGPVAHSAPRSLLSDTHYSVAPIKAGPAKMEPREPGWEHEVSHPPSFLLHSAPTFLVSLTISDAWGGDEG